MANQAIKTREEVNEDLQASGIEPKQARAVVQATGDTVARLDLLTRTEWKAQCEKDQAQRQEDRETLQKQRAEDQAQRKEDWQRIQKRMDKLEEAQQRTYLWVRWGLFIIVSMLLAMPAWIAFLESRFS